jgi:hypothetical protein
VKQLLLHCRVSEPYHRYCRSVGDFAHGSKHGGLVSMGSYRTQDDIECRVRCARRDLVGARRRDLQPGSLQEEGENMPSIVMTIYEQDMYRSREGGFGQTTGGHETRGNEVPRWLDFQRSGKDMGPRQGQRKPKSESVLSDSARRMATIEPRTEVAPSVASCRSRCTGTTFELLESYTDVKGPPRGDGYEHRPLLDDDG